MIMSMSTYCLSLFSECLLYKSSTIHLRFVASASIFIVLSSSFKANLIQLKPVLYIKIYFNFAKEMPSPLLHLFRNTIHY